MEVAYVIKKYCLWLSSLASYVFHAWFLASLNFLVLILFVCVHMSSEGQSLGSMWFYALNIWLALLSANSWLVFMFSCPGLSFCHS